MPTHHPWPRRILGLALLLAVVAGPAWSQEPARVATFHALESPASDGARAVAPRRAAAPASAPSLAPNAALSSATCQGVSVVPVALSSYIFGDGFERGDAGDWQAEPQSFSVRGVTDLQFRVLLDGFAGEALLHLDLTSPRGHRYQSLDAPLAAGAEGVSNADLAGSSGTHRLLPGYPHPVELRRVTSPEKAAGPQMASMDWQVAGTLVVHHGLYGTWSAAASLSNGPGEPAAVVCPSTQFTLRP